MTLVDAHEPHRVARLLVADDEPTIRELLTDFFVLEGYDVKSVADGNEALDALGSERFDAVLLDLKMPGFNGLEVLERSRHLAQGTVFVMMTGFGTMESAISAMKSGAHDYILKPFKVQEVIRLVARAIGEQRLKQENIQLKEAVRLFEFSEQMSATLELGRVYELLVQTAREEIEAAAVGLWVKDPAHAGRWALTKRWSRVDLEPDQVGAIDGVDVARVLEEAEGGRSMIFHDERAQEVIRGLEPGRMVSMLGVPLRTKSQVVGLLAALSFDEQNGFSEGRRKMLSVLAARASAALENARLYDELRETFKQTIQAFANLLEDKDPYTRGHSERVAKYARMIAEGLELPAEEVEEVEDCALMHDIGKLGIRFEDLNKVEPLTEAEYEMFKSHTTRGKWILEPIPFLHHLIPGVYYHHERWDGRGYPMGLSGEDIPLVARILAVADTYDAMTSHRAYRRALSHDVALREIEAFSGVQFEPRMVEVFVREMEKARGGYASKAQRWQALLKVS